MLGCMPSAKSSVAEVCRTSWNRIFGTLDSRVWRVLGDRRVHMLRPVFAIGEHEIVIVPDRSETESLRMLRRSVLAQRLHA